MSGAMVPAPRRAPGWHDPQARLAVECPSCAAPAGQPCAGSWDCVSRDIAAAGGEGQRPVMTWRSDLINGMDDRERMMLLGLIAGGRPAAFDWAADRLGGSFAERFAEARPAATERPSRRCLIPAEHGMSHCWCADPGHRPEPVHALLEAGHSLTWERDVTGGWFAIVRDSHGAEAENGLGPDKLQALAHLAERLERRGITATPPATAARIVGEI